jgi:hypothetical protein
MAWHWATVRQVAQRSIWAQGFARAGRGPNAVRAKMPFARTTAALIWTFRVDCMILSSQFNSVEPIMPLRWPRRRSRRLRTQYIWNGSSDGVTSCMETPERQSGKSGFQGKCRRYPCASMIKGRFPPNPGTLLFPVPAHVSDLAFQALRIIAPYAASTQKHWNLPQCLMSRATSLLPCRVLMVNALLNP